MNSEDKLKLVQRLSQIEQINKWEREFRKQKGMSTFNISSWRIAEKFREQMLRVLDLPTTNDLIDYIYTYSLQKELKQTIIDKLSGERNLDLVGIITPNNTISIINVANVLKAYGYKKVCIINPNYFSVAQTFRVMGISYQCIGLLREDGKYILPLDKILAGNFDAVWITSPIYSTGVYFAESEITKIEYLISNKIMVIADESFAINKMELIRQITPNEYFIGIYSPHKAICCNGIKFSIILVPEMYEDFLEQWVDVFSGNLPYSSIVAANHFITENYDECNKVFQESMDNTRIEILRHLCNLPKDIDYNTEGSLMTFYFRNVPTSNNYDRNFYFDLYEATSGSIYPGDLNGFGQHLGFCFRINLALDSVEFRQSVYRVITYLTNRYHGES